MATAEVRELRVPDWSYSVSGKHEAVLLPLDIVVRCSSADVPLTKPMVVLPHAALPFGLLESVEVQATDEGALPKHRFHIMKATGMRVSPPVESGQPVILTYRDMNNNEDAADPAFKDVAEWTGHYLQHRCVSGGAVLGLAIEFYGPAPRCFDVVFHTANAVDKPMTADKARKKFAAKERVPLRLPPTPITARLRQARPQIEAAIQRAT